MYAFGGRYAQPNNPWMKWDEDDFCVDFGCIHEHLDGCSDIERSFLMFVVSLASENETVCLEQSVFKKDRELSNLVLAAISHAGGSQWDMGMGPLHPWPALPEKN